MRIQYRLIGCLAMLVAMGTSCGCLHTQLNTARRVVPPALPTAAPWLASGEFATGGIHGFGSAWCLWPTPVSPAFSDEIEKFLERCEKDGVPILGPIKGEFAPVFCMDPPSELEMYETLKPIVHGVPFVYEVQRKNVRFSIEKLVDQVDECRIFPLAGPCQLHHCHFKCTIWWDETTTMGWPIPWQYTDHKQEVVYIDKDHLHRCGEPGNLAPVGGPSTFSHY